MAMPAPKGNRNRALSPELRRQRSDIMLNPSEREFFASIGKGKVSTGIHRAFDILREDKSLAAAADISAQPRTLVAFTEDGAQTLLVAHEGLQFAVLRGEVVIVCVGNLSGPISAGWCGIDHPERASRLPENYQAFARVSAVAPNTSKTEA